MKKIFALMLCVLLCLSLCACGSGSDKQTLIVGFDAEFPPFGFIAADGSYDGFDLAMARELCKRLGWEYKEVAIDWNSKDTELASGNINCIWNGFTYTGREDEYTWSDPYVDNSIVLVVKKDSGIASKADLAGKTVMAQAVLFFLFEYQSDVRCSLQDAERTAVVTRTDALENRTRRDRHFSNVELFRIHIVVVLCVCYSTL